MRGLQTRLGWVKTAKETEIFDQSLYHGNNGIQLWKTNGIESCISAFDLYQVRPSSDDLSVENLRFFTVFTQPSLV